MLKLLFTFLKNKFKNFCSSDHIKDALKLSFILKFIRRKLLKKKVNMRSNREKKVTGKRK